MKPILIPVTIAGIPAKVKVTHYKVVEAIDSDASDADAAGWQELEYEVCDRRGYPAKWLEKLMKPAAFNQLDQQIEAYFQQEAASHV